jgi:hypothetical protein
MAVIKTYRVGGGGAPRHRSKRNKAARNERLNTVYMIGLIVEELYPSHKHTLTNPGAGETHLGHTATKTLSTKNGAQHSTNDANTRPSTVDALCSDNL